MDQAAWLIETYDKPDAHQLRQRLRPTHLEYLDSIADKLLACGAKLSDDGSRALGGVYLVDAPTRDAAQALIESDPFTRGGLFDRVTIHRWRVAYLNRTCHLDEP